MIQAFKNKLIVRFKIPLNFTFCQAKETILGKYSLKTKMAGCSSDGLYEQYRNF
jgi:hypothetical protein